jgi:hypothetical protein
VFAIPNGTTAFDYLRPVADPPTFKVECKGDANYLATMVGSENLVWATGYTKAEALGNLVVMFPNVCGIRIES